MLTSAGVNRKEVFPLLEEHVNDCELCLKHKKAPAMPVVSLPMASSFNETKALDLFEFYRSIWFLSYGRHVF